MNKGQLNRRLHKISKNLWDAVLKKLFYKFTQHNLENEFIIDSFPISTCKLVRQNKTKLYYGKKYLGYCAAKQEYFLGFKLHMISDYLSCNINLNNNTR